MLTPLDWLIVILSFLVTLVHYLIYRHDKIGMSSTRFSSMHWPMIPIIVIAVMGIVGSVNNSVAMSCVSLMGSEWVISQVLLLMRA